MGLLKAVYRTELTSAKRALLLAKIKRLLTEKASRLVIEVDGQRFNSQEASNFAFDPSLGADNLEFTRPSGPTIFASLVVQDLTYTAKAAGAGGNAISIEYVDDGTAGAETVGVVGNAITVHMEDGVSTATQISAAIIASVPASALVSVAISGTAGDFQAAAAADNLEGGDDVEHYDNADIVEVRRLRTKKWLVKISSAADPLAD